MGMLEAVATCLRKYATFSGRARRPEYWWFVLALVVATVIASAIDAALFGKGYVVETTTADGAGFEAAVESTGPVSAILGLATFLPGLAVVWRRLHDVGRPGWVALTPHAALLAGAVAAGLGGSAVLLAVGAVASLVLLLHLLYLLVQPGAPGPNAYGPEPAG